MLLLIACANVANLLIARMAVRENEIAVRLAIGAGRARLAQQLLIEASLLSAVGCIGGLLLALAGMRVLLALRPESIPRVSELRVDWLVLAFAIVISAGTAIVLGLVASWRGARGDLRAALAQSQRTQGGGGASYRIRGSLVVVQLAMTVVLLIGAGLLARSFVRLMTIDTGFRTHGVVVANLSLRRAVKAAIPSESRAARSMPMRSLHARAHMPGVTAVGVSDARTLSPEAAATAVHRALRRRHEARAAGLDEGSRAHDARQGAHRLRHLPPGERRLLSRAAHSAVERAACSTRRIARARRRSPS